MADDILDAPPILRPVASLVAARQEKREEEKEEPSSQ